MRLLRLARSYVATHLISRRHAEDIISICRRCTSIQQAKIVDYLRRLQTAGCSAATIARHRRIILAVINWAASEGICEPIRLPRIRTPLPIPQAWTLAEVSRLLQTATTLRHYVDPRLLISVRSAADVLPAPKLEPEQPQLRLWG